MATHKPGPGWQKITSAVYENSLTKTHIHLYGLVKLDNGDVFNMFDIQYHQDADKYIAINGGNHKRGLMAWAAALTEEYLESMGSDPIDAPSVKRIGVAKGLFVVPDSIEAHNDEVARLFTGPVGS